MDEPIAYRSMRPGEEANVCRLVERVFDEFVAPDFAPEGIEEFRKFANPQSLADRTRAGSTVLLALRGDEIVGMIEIGSTPQVGTCDSTSRCGHISMLFVSQRGQGIARELVRRAVDRMTAANADVAEITVHSSLYAQPVYERLGFQRTGETRTENGITYLPMSYHVSR